MLNLAAQKSRPPDCRGPCLLCHILSTAGNSPVLALDPGGQELPQLHGEAVTVQVIQLLQIPRLQLL